jgi:hypothetical protein
MAQRKDNWDGHLTRVSLHGQDGELIRMMTVTPDEMHSGYGGGAAVADQRREAEGAAAATRALLLTQVGRARRPTVLQLAKGESVIKR